MLRYGLLPLVLTEIDDAADVLEAYVANYVREEIQQEAIVGSLASFARFLDVAADPSRRLGPITKAGSGHARRAPVEAAWASRYPAKVSAHLQKRIERCQTPIQEISWQAPAPGSSVDRSRL